MNDTACADDFDCPGAFWCYQIGESSFCGCPNQAGAYNITSTCEDKAPLHIVNLVLSFLCLLAAIVIVGYYIWMLLMLAKNDLPRLSPAMRILISSMVSLFCLIVSTILKLCSSLFWDVWIAVKAESTGFMKQSLYTRMHILFFVFYTVAVFCATAETGLLWLEVAISASRLEEFKKFKWTRLIASLFEFSLVLFGTISIATTNSSENAFLLTYMAFPMISLLFVLIIGGRFYLIRLLLKKRRVSASLENSSINSKFISIARTIDQISAVLLFCMLMLFADNKWVSLYTIGTLLIEYGTLIMMTSLLRYSFKALETIASKINKSKKASIDYGQSLEHNDSKTMGSSGAATKQTNETNTPVDSVEAQL